MKDKTIVARVLVKMTLDGKPVAINDRVMVDSDTFRNLVAKGRLEAADTVADADPYVPPAAPKSDAGGSPAVKHPKK